MQPAQAQVLNECVRGSLSGEITFPEILDRLSAIGVERYHTDYSRKEVTFYFPNGDSLVVPLPIATRETGTEFSSSNLEAAVRQSQSGEHTYPEFIRKSMEAGCVGYFVQITGRRVIYFGRKGECHVERFPSP